MSPVVYGVVSGFCSFLQFIAYCAFFVATVTAVRSRRPDAWGLLAAGSGTLLADFTLRVALGILLPIAMERSSSGMTSYFGLEAMLQVVGTIVSIFGWSMMLIGVVRIASPPREQNLNRAPGDY